MRPRVYVTDLDSNSVIAIDTVTLKVVGILPTGARPVDMAITLDGSRLYVVNNGSTTEAIDLIDLDSFTEQNSFPLPHPPTAVAAGRDGRLYVGTENANASLYQLDGATGAVQAIVPQSLAKVDLLQITPDGNTLFVSSTQLDPARVRSFDVSTDTASVLQSRRYEAGNYTYIMDLVVSHDGVYLCLPGFLGALQTELFSAADIAESYGAIADSFGLAAFSPDDRLVYSEGRNNTVGVYDTQTFALLDQATLPPPIVTQGFPAPGLDSLTVDNTGSYLIVCQSGEPNAHGISHPVGLVSILGTGGGSGLPQAAPVVVSLAATKSTVVAGSGHRATFTLTRTGDLTRPLTVGYAIRGTAENGVDYAELSGAKYFAPGVSSATVQIVPADDIGPRAKTVTLSLKSRPAYQRADAFQATVTIRPSR